MAIENLDIQISSSADRASQSIDSMIERLTRLQTMLTDVASRVNNIQWPTNAGAGGGFDGLREAANNANSLGEALDDVVHQAGGLAGAAGQAENLGNSMANAANHSNLLTSALGGVARATYSVGAYFAGQGFSSIRKYASGVSTLFSQLKRVAMYRVIRTVIKEITQGFAEGQKNLYNWSKSVGGTFATNMNTLATASQYLKNSLAAMASPLYTAVAPAIDYIVDKFVDMFNFVNQLFARLSGATTYTVAKKVAATWGDASKNAGATAAAAKRTILSFDEINKLTSASSGGGGSGGSGSSGSGMFETRTIDDSVSTFADSLKEAFQNQDWEALGTLLGEKVNELVEKIDWAGAGTKVGTYINAWFSTKYWTLDTINFTNIGSKIAEFLNNAIAQIDFNIIGRSLVQGAEILGDLIIGFFTDFDWGQAADAFSSFVKGIYDEITKWFNKYANSDEMNWGDIGRIIWEKLSDALANFDLGGIASSMMTALGTALRSAIQLGAGFVAAFWSDVADWWDKNIKADTFTDTVLNILDAIGQGFSNIGQWVYDNIIDPFITALTGNEDWDKDLLEVGATIWNTIKEGISNAVKNVGSWIKEHIFKPFISAWNWLFGKSDENDVSNSVVSNADVDASQAEELRKLGREMGKYIKDGISDKMKNAGNDAWNAVVSGWNGVKDKTLNAELTFTSSDDAWKTFKAGWDTQSHILEFGAAWSSDSPDGELYSTFIQGWNSAARYLRFNPGWTSDTPVADTYNNFVKSWAAYGRWLRFNPGWTSDTPVADMYNNFVKSWNAYAKYLRFNPGWTSATPVRDMYENFVKSWNAVAKWLRFNPGWTSSTPVRDMYENFVKSWNSAAKWLRFNPGWTSTTPVRDMYENFVKSWNSSAKWLKFNPGWTSSTPVADMYNNFVKSWNSSAKWLKFNPGWTSSTPVRDMYENFVKSWNSSAKWLKFNPGWKSDTPAAELYNTVSNVWGQADRVLKFIGNWWDKTPANKLLNGLKDAWNLIKPSKRTLDLYAKAINSADSIWEDFKKAWNNKSRKVTATIEYTTVGGGGSTSGGGAGRTARANGGIITPYWISDFANGGIFNPHGTLFRAGENGPEIVGHIGGRTEVLNRSQLASTMYSSVRAAMAPAFAYEAASDEGMELLGEYMMRAVDAAMAKDRELMRQQNEYLRQINDKEFTAEISTAAINRAQNRTNRRAGTPVSPVAVG